MFNNIANGTLLIIAGIFMILSGVSLLGKLNFLNRIEHSNAQLLLWYREILGRKLLPKELKKGLIIRAFLLLFWGTFLYNWGLFLTQMGGGLWYLFPFWLG